MATSPLHKGPFWGPARRALPLKEERFSTSICGDSYDKSHGSGLPHLNPGELQKVWHPDKPATSPKK